MVTDNRCKEVTEYREGSYNHLYETQFYDEDIEDSKLHDFKYLRMLIGLKTHGRVKESRAVLSDGTKPKTRSKFGAQIKFDISRYFPLLTSKKMYWKGIVHELIWFLKGSTNIKYLVDNNVNIWNDNAYDYYKKVILKNHLSKDDFLYTIKNNDRESLKRNSPFMHYTYGDLGPVYGQQWRSWDGEDQISNLIKDINEVKVNPNCSCSRRLMLSAWNVPKLKSMALVPCHVLYQFDVYEGEISCNMYQRSADYVLGSPFNIASASLLTYLLAKTCDLKPKDFIYSLGDVHIYENHLESVEEQLNNEIHNSPTLEVLNRKDNLEDYLFEDLKLNDYKYSELKSKPEMAV